MSKYPFSEYDLRLNYVSYISVLNEEFDAYQEVPVFCRSVDLVLQDKYENSITAIEFKLFDWKRAIKQIEIIKICFDYFCICLPKPKTLKGELSVIESCENNQIGLIWYDIVNNSFEKKLTFPRSELIWDAQKKQIISYLESQER